MIKVRPFFKWAGSKYNCLQKILPSLPAGERLIEPFLGSGAVFMNTNYPSYLLAESNADLVDFFTTLQTEGSDFIHFCKGYFQPKFNCQEAYYKYREAFNSLPTSKEKSALFLYLNRHGYNGLCRYNSKGGFNVPFGRYVKPYFPFNEMNLFHQKSKEACFLHADFKETFTKAKPGDVIYCDPPYVPLAQKSATFSYNKIKFQEQQQIELAMLAEDASTKGVKVLISNHDTEFTRCLYKNADIVSFEVSRTISCLGHSRQPIKELLAIYN